jgi:glycosyltransferase involved in cell wall biosynthesis
MKHCLANDPALPGPPKILLVISTLEGGGAERVMTYLLRHWDRISRPPVLVLLKEAIAYGQDIPANTRIVPLTRGSFYNVPRLIKGLCRVMIREKPDVVLSFLTFANWLTIVAHRISGGGIPLLISERNHLSQSLAHVRLGRLKGLLTRLLYRRPDSIICISRGIKSDLTANFGVPAGKCVVISNPCDLERINLLAAKGAAHPWFEEDMPVFAAISRLTEQKNYPLLLRALALVRRKTPVRLMILGQGEERLRLEVLAQSLGVGDAVTFLGFQANPFAYLARARALVLSSSWEGFANVILEAMALAVPVVATRCPSGPEEIITHGVNGLLTPVDDAPALAAAMTLLATDSGLASRLGAAGRRRAEDFRLEPVVRQYESAIAAAGSNRTATGARQLFTRQSSGEVSP